MAFSFATVRTKRHRRKRKIAAPHIDHEMMAGEIARIIDPPAFIVGAIAAVRQTVALQKARDIIVLYQQLAGTPRVHVIVRPDGHKYVTVGKKS